MMAYNCLMNPGRVLEKMIIKIHIWQQTNLSNILPVTFLLYCTSPPPPNHAWSNCLLPVQTFPFNYRMVATTTITVFPITENKSYPISLKDNFYELFFQNIWVGLRHNCSDLVVVILPALAFNEFFTIANLIEVLSDLPTKAYTK